MIRQQNTTLYYIGCNGNIQETTVSFKYVVTSAIHDNKLPLDTIFNRVTELASPTLELEVSPISHVNCTTPLEGRLVFPQTINVTISFATLLLPRGLPVDCPYINILHPLCTGTKHISYILPLQLLSTALVIIYLPRPPLDCRNDNIICKKPKIKRGIYQVVRLLSK